MTSLHEPLSIRSLLDGAMRRARRHFASIYPASALPMALLAGATPFVQGLWMHDLTVRGDAPPDLPRLFSAMGVVFVVAAIFMVCHALVYSVQTGGALDAVLGRPVSMARSYRAVLQPRVLITFLILYPALFVAWMCCLLPGIYLALLWSLIVPVMLEEQRFLIAGLGRSADLARYNPSRQFSADPRVRAFLLYLVGLLVGYAASFVVQLPLMIVQQVRVFRGVAAGTPVDPVALAQGLMWLQVPTVILASLAQTAVQLFVSFGIALLYVDVRQRQEGRDLEAAVDRLALDSPLAGV